MQHLADLLGLEVLPPLSPRYNITPSQLVACVWTNPESNERECVELKWGLVPSWAKDPSIGNKLINARAETVAEKPSFRKAFKHQRCLVLADGFYEWKREGKAKQPYYIRFKDGRLFAFAGLWERWEKQDPALETCALITTSPNALMEPIHDRMPAILSEQSYASWLNPGPKNTIYLSQFLTPYDAEEMEAYPISTVVNNPRNEGPLCIHPQDEIVMADTDKSHQGSSSASFSPADVVSTPFRTEPDRRGESDLSCVSPSPDSGPVAS